jgi:hypothetical protein
MWNASQDHAAFKSLLNNRDPNAVEIWGKYTSSNDQTSFFRDLMQLVQHSKRITDKSKSAPHSTDEKVDKYIFSSIYIFNFQFQMLLY